MTGFNGLFGLPFLTEITLWALTAASAVTIVQRMVMVHGQSAQKPLPPAQTS
jgi:CDP-diacylglycerol--glycerol-3-phosphate 3-phosphatidyltransferase/CDP-diacylglycerol--inositol 3-phosphatidyltransferase